MAKELEITATLRYRKGSVSEDVSLSSKLDVTGNRVTQLVQRIGTGAELVLLGDIKTNSGEPGFIIVENLDVTGVVSLHRTTSESAFIKIRPKSFAGPFELASTGKDLGASANVDSDIRITVIQR